MLIVSAAFQQKVNKFKHVLNPNMFLLTYSWFSKGMVVSTLLLLLSSMVEGGRKRKGFLRPGRCWPPGVMRLPSLSVEVRYESSFT